MNRLPAALARNIPAFLLVGLLIQSCSMLQAKPSSQIASTPEYPASTSGITGVQSPTGTEIPAASTDFPTPVPGPLDWLLGLRSVIIEHGITYPDGSTYATTIEIDNSGNMRAIQNRPVALYTNDLPDPKVMDATKLSGVETLYVISGKAYQPDSSNPSWKTTPVDDDYIQTISEKLNGPDGPGLWLDILDDTAFLSAGNENMGGFDTNKYTVNGQFNQQTIQGTIWIESKTKALLKADLTVPAILLDPSDKTGLLKITLNTHQATVDPVTLPDISMLANTPAASP